MAKIEEYTSKKELKPSDVGYSALETGARRVGPLAQQAAADIEKQGKMAAEFATNSAKFAYEFTSPFADLLDKERGGRGTSKVNLKPERTLIGTGSGDPRINDSSANLAGQAVKYNGPDVATGAAKLSSRLKNAIAPGGPAVDPISGQPMGTIPGQAQQYWKDPETGKLVPIPQDPAEQASGITGPTVLRGGQGPSPSSVTIIRGGSNGQLTSVGDWNGGGTQPLGFTGPDGQRYMPASGASYGGLIDDKEVKKAMEGNEPITPGETPGLNASQKAKDMIDKLNTGMGITKDANGNPVDYQGNPITGPGVPLAPATQPASGWYGAFGGTETVGSVSTGYNQAGAEPSTSAGPYTGYGPTISGAPLNPLTPVLAPASDDSKAGQGGVSQDTIDTINEAP